MTDAGHSIATIRRRPGMYIGDTDDGTGLHHLLWEVVANSVDQHLLRAATELHVDIDGTLVTVRDDGPGMALATRMPNGQSVAELIFTHLHAGATWDDHSPHVHLSGGLHGVGLVAVNALCSRFAIESVRDGERWRQSFERGVPMHPLERGATQTEGTRIQFEPDGEVFSNRQFDVEAIRSRLQELAWLNPLFRVHFQGERVSGRFGLAGWIRNITGARPGLPIEASYSICRTVNDVFVDIALSWQGRGRAQVQLFSNQSRTAQGPHWPGLLDGFTHWCSELGLPSEPTQVREALEPGLIAVVHVGLYVPRFGGPTKRLLLNPEAGTAVQRVLSDDAARAVSSRRLIFSFLRARLG